MQINILLKKIYDSNGIDGLYPDAIITKYKKQWYIDHNTLQKETKILINLWILMLEFRFYKKQR